MNNQKIGNLIKQLRTEKGLTQKELADMLTLSDRTISKWERGVGCPDVSLLNDLSNIFKIDIKQILDGELVANNFVNGNLKNSKFFVCETCNNLLISTGNATIYCCGRKLLPKNLIKATDADKLTVETIENDWYISSNHPMEKEHYISFIALLTGDSIKLTKLYPEWNMQLRIPKREHGMLIWYCTNHGLFYQLI